MRCLFLSSRDELTSYTLNPSILRMRAVCSVTVITAVNKSGLSCCAGNIIEQYTQTSALPKVCTAIGNCICRVIMLKLILELMSYTWFHSPEPENPSCRQATLASTVSQKSSHTVPQSPFRQTSTLPFKLVEPELSLMLP